MTTSHINSRNNWTFETVQIRARKNSGTHGEPYTAIANITIVNGEPHIEGFLSTSKISREDINEITSYISSLGFTHYYIKRDNNIQKVTL